jgi:tetratricopeptide (TPR) repeat protein
VTVSLITRTLQPAGCTVDVELWARPFVAGDAMRFYATQIVWPRSLGIDYGRTPLAVLASFPACIAAMAMWAIVLVLCLLPRFRRWRVCLLVSIVPLIPVLGFAPFLFQNYSTVADRYAYLAMLGPALALTWTVPALAAVVSARAAGFLAASVIFTMAVMAFVQTLTWRDSLAVNLHAIRVNAGSFLGVCNLGAAMLSTDRPDDAIIILKEAIDRGPRHLNARLCLGIAMERTGRLDEAAQYYRSVLFIEPRHAKALNYLGVVRARQGHLDIAMSLFEEALEADPSYSDAMHNLDRARRMLRPESAGESGP